jgi:hypothetical protein
MKVKARVRCDFDIEYDDDNNDIEYTKENITMETVRDLLDVEIEESLEIIKILSIQRQ